MAPTLHDDANIQFVTGLADGGTGADLSATTGVWNQATAGAVVVPLATTGTGNVVRATSPTIVTPTIASFASATHDHSNAAGGGTIAAAALAAWTTPAFAAGDFTASSGAWTVAAPDAVTNKYVRIGNTVTWSFYLLTTTVTATPSILYYALPAALVPTGSFANAFHWMETSTVGTGFVRVNAGVSRLEFLKSAASATFGITTDATYIIGSLTFEVDP